MFFRDKAQGNGWLPAVESIQDSERVIFRIALPDVDPRTTGLLLLGNQLILKGARTITQKGENGASPSSDNAGEWFERSLLIPEGVPAEKITACYSNGCLEITIPTPTRLVAKRIPIEVK
jgi:HSP20 family molecular chaperone IbpA